MDLAALLLDTRVLGIERVESNLQSRLLRRILVRDLAAVVVELVQELHRVVEVLDGLVRPGLETVRAANNFNAIASESVGKGVTSLATTSSSNMPEDALLHFVFARLSTEDFFGHTTLLWEFTAARSTRSSSGSFPLNFPSSAAKLSAILRDYFRALCHNFRSYTNVPSSADANYALHIACISPSFPYQRSCSISTQPFQRDDELPQCRYSTSRLLCDGPVLPFIPFLGLHSASHDRTVDFSLTFSAPLLIDVN